MADLAPAGRATVPLQVAGRDDFLWLGTLHSLFAHVGAKKRLLLSTPKTHRLAQLDAMHREDHILREGWVFLVGTIDRDGHAVPVLHPLLSRPVRLRKSSPLDVSARYGAPTQPRPTATMTLEVDGEAEVSPLIDDPELRASLESQAQFGGGGLAGDQVSSRLIERMPKLRDWARSTAQATGLPFRNEGVELRDPFEVLSKGTAPRLVYGSGVYVQTELPRAAVGTALESWSKRNVGESAFGVMVDGTVDEPVDHGSTKLDSAFILSPSQRRVVMTARRRRLTVVSGAPGNGKNHTVAAIALDHVARGHSVLVATRSRFAARSVAEIVDRVPGPDALCFGDIVDGSSVIDELQETLVEDDGAGMKGATAELDLARRRRDAVESAIETALCLEAEAAADQGSRSTVTRTVAPGAFDVDADLERLNALVDDARRTRRGPFRNWRTRRARAAMAAALGAAPDIDPALAATALAAARARRSAIRLAASGGTVVAELWDELARLDDAVRVAAGLEARSNQDLGRRARGAVGQLLAALRAGRGQRRTLLGQIDPGALTAAVPLWIGTLGDIEDLLPGSEAMFDLVILDEASHVDQMSAAPALLRGRRAVVVGDPNQLRHVSFLSDAAITDAMADHGVGDLAATIDLRRNSAFDRAAAVSPVIALVEHYRSIPHLVEFPIAEFYRNRIDVMTRRPDNDALDVIDLHVPRHPGAAAEIDAVMDLLEQARPEDGTIGVVTPFREHADRLEAAVLERFDEDRILALGLRVGTVHAFQGAERDLTVIALGLDADDPPGRLAFVENANLFNVMVTRARRRIVVVSAVTEPRRGLLQRYLDHGSRPPVPPSDEGCTDRWSVTLAGELERAGFDVRRGYRIGPWQLELVVNGLGGAVALETCVHAGDPSHHVERHRALTRLGWRMIDAYPTRWDGDVVRACIDLTTQLRANGLPTD